MTPMIAVFRDLMWSLVTRAIIPCGGLSYQESGEAESIEAFALCFFRGPSYTAELEGALR